MSALSPGPQRLEKHLSHSTILQSILDGGEPLHGNQPMRTHFLTTACWARLKTLTTILNLKADTPNTFGDHFYSSLLEKFLWTCRAPKIRKRGRSVPSRVGSWLWAWLLQLRFVIDDCSSPPSFRGVGREGHHLSGFQLGKKRRTPHHPQQGVRTMWDTQKSSTIQTISP